MLKKLINSISREDGIFFGIYILFLSVVFKDLLIHLDTNLVSWLDYPLVVWINFQHVQKILTLDFAHYFSTNAFYPNPSSLLFADTFIPQALMMLPFYAITKELIFSFNIMFLLTLILNYVAAYVMWGVIFKERYQRFIATLFSVFGTFFVLQLGHFQMITMWPFFFAMTCMFWAVEKKSRLFALMTGLLLTVQFLSSFYLSIFFGIVLVVFSTLKTIYEKRSYPFVLLLISLVVFAITSGPIIKGYFEVRKEHSVERNVNPAHISDYIFTHNQSLLYKTSLFTKWSSFNMHTMTERAAFPGILMIILAFYGFFMVRKKKNTISIHMSSRLTDIFFLVIMSIGIYLSLSPRLFFNGAYAQIPTGYNLVLKAFPFLSMIRAGARWAFLIYLGGAYFAAQGLKNIMTRITIDKNIILIMVLVIFFVEYLPFKLNIHAEEYIYPRHLSVQTICYNDPSKVILEYPVTHLNAHGGIINGLNYISKVMLAHSYHQCNMVNGYSGVDLLSLQTLHQNIRDALLVEDYRALEKVLSKNNIDVILINQNYIIEPKLIPIVQKLDKELPDVDVILE